MLNAAVDVFNAGVIPVWNAATFYIVEPALMLVIEIFSMVFTGEEYTGVIDPASYTYNGLDCTSSAEAAEWCGAFCWLGTVVHRCSFLIVLPLCGRPVRILRSAARVGCTRVGVRQ